MTDYLENKVNETIEKQFKDIQKDLKNDYEDYKKFKV